MIGHSLVIAIGWIIFAGRAKSKSTDFSAEFDQLYSWKSVYSVNSTCPKFIVVDVKGQGLGDMLCRIYSGAASAYLSQTTLAFHSDSYHHSVHYPIGYAHIMENELAVPIRKFLLLKDIVSAFNPQTLSPQLLPDSSLYNPDFSLHMPCNSLYHMSDLNMCTSGKNKVWCMSYIASTIQSVMRPFFDESIAVRKAKHFNYTLTEPLSVRKLNVVWHIRTGDLCLRCNDDKFYKNIDSFIGNAVGNIPRQNIIVHQEEPRIKKIFESIENVIHYEQDEIYFVVRLFMQADIFITTGSTFANNIAALLPLFRPVVIQATDKEAVQAYHDEYHHRDVIVKNIRDKYTLPEGRAIRVDDNGNSLSHFPDDLEFLLRSNGVLNRIQST